ncbi:MAG: DUF1275 domain-containing protein [Acidobacteriia bacterium]|nr:DUF1275 domain-containing protein [Terriglobia bacterium]
MRDPLEGRRWWVALGLTWVAGFVDVVGWVALYHVYTANMTGNTVAMAYRWGQRRWAVGLARGYPILMFVAGVFVSGVVFRLAQRRRPRRMVLPTVLAAEAALLVAFFGLGFYLLPPGHPTAPSPAVWAALATVAGLAMGLQNGSLAASGTLTVYTTHVTGTLTKMAEKTVEHLFWLYDRTTNRGARRRWAALRLSPRQPAFREAMKQATLWCNYLCGGVVGAVLLRALGVRSLLAPVAAVVLLALATIRWPVEKL